MLLFEDTIKMSFCELIGHMSVFLWNLVCFGDLKGAGNAFPRSTDKQIANQKYNIPQDAPIIFLATRKYIKDRIYI